MSSAPRPDLGTVGPYELRAVLGQGGMGTVYRAWSPRHGREVALKLCAPGLASAEDCARLVREARLLAGVDHPFLIGFLDAGESRATPYLVMELVEGETLASTWARDPLWDPARAVSLVRQLAEGAGELHRLGIVHRDLKPANVLLDRRGSPQIADLGLAAGEAMSRLTQTGAVVGTPAYMAPEQVMAGRLTPATDVYALGVILFQLLTGRLPFAGHTPLQLLTQQLEARPPSVRALCPAAGPELAALVACCLEKDPGDRFPDGAGLARALGELSRADPRGGGAPAAPQRLTFVAALAAVAALGAATTAVVFSQQGATQAAPAAAAPAPPQDLGGLLAEGERMLEANAFGDAETVFARAVELAPRSAEAWAGYGRVASGEHRLRSAEERFDRALACDPRNLRALLGKAVTCSERTELAEAEAHLARALEVDPQALPARIFAGQLHLLRGDHEAARRTWEAILAEEPGCHDAARLLAASLLASGRTEEAMTVARSALEHGPDPQLEARVLYCLARLERPLEELRDALSAARARHPGDLDLLGAGADLLAARGDAAGAYALVDQLLARYPRSPHPLQIRAVVRLTLNEDLPLALADLEQVRRELPEWPAVLLLGARLGLRIGDGDRALDYARALAELCPRDPGAWRWFAQAALTASDLPAADLGLARLWALDPSEWAAAGACFQQFSREDYRGALAAAERGLEAFPDSLTLTVLRQGALLYQGDPGALAALRGLATSDQAVEANLILASHFLKQGQTEEARPYLLALERASKTLPASYTLRGDYARQLGLTRQAAEAYEVALATNPRSGEALLGLAQVYDALGNGREALGLARLAAHSLDSIGRLPTRAAVAHALVARLEAAGTEALELELDAPPAALLALGERALEARDHTLAAAAFRAALHQELANGEAWLGLCRVAGRRAFSDCPRAYLAKALLTAPRDPRVLVLAANLAHEAGNPEEARRVHARLERLHPDDPWTAYDRGQLLFLAGELPAARAAFEHAVARFPTNEEVARGLIDVHWTSGDAERALEAEAAFARATGSDALAFERAKVSIQAGRGAEAREACSRVLELHPREARAWAMRGVLRLGDGALEDGVADCRQALALFPFQPLLRCRLAEQAYRAGRAEDGERELQLAWSCAGSEDLLRVALRAGHFFLEELQALEQALRWAERACAADARSALALALRAEARRRLGDAGGAERDFREALERDPEQLEALRFLAEEALARLDRAEADALSLRLLELAPADWRSHTLRGRVLLHAGQTREAWPRLLRGAELAPTRVRSLLPVVTVGADLGEWEAVRDHAQRCLALDLSEAEGALVRERLRAANARLGQ